MIDYKKDYYEILTVPEEATKEEILSAYKSQIKIFHPDNVCCSKNLQKAYEEKFKEIQEAYEVLIDDKLREEYNIHRENYNVSNPVNNNFQNKKSDCFWDKMAYASIELYNTKKNKICVKNVLFVDRVDSNGIGCLFIVVIIIFGFFLGFFFF